MHRLSLTTAQRFVLAACVALIAYALFGPSLAFAGETTTGDAALGAPFELLHFGSTGLVGLYAWVSSGQRVLQRQHDAAIEQLGKRIARNRQELEARLGSVEQRIGAREEAAKHTPTAEQITDLIEKIGELRADIREQKSGLDGFHDAVKGLARRFDNYETHMLTRGVG